MIVTDILLIITSALLIIDIYPRVLNKIKVRQARRLANDPELLKRTHKYRGRIEELNKNKWPIDGKPETIIPFDELKTFVDKAKKIES